MRSDVFNFASTVSRCDKNAKLDLNLFDPAVALKLPDYWTDKPEAWFAHIEAQFNTKGINQDGTKFDYLVSALDNVTAGEVEAVLLNPPAADKYAALKKACLQAFAKTQTQKDAGKSSSLLSGIPSSFRPTR